MKKLVAIFAVFALAFVFPAPASAEEGVTEPAVTVGDFGQYLVQKGKKVTVTPEVVKQGAVTVKSAKMTVKHGKKTVAKNVKKAKLRAGSYQVTTTITWTASPDPTVRTTIETKPLRITTFSASKQANALLAYINAARLKAPAIIDVMDKYSLDPSYFTLHRASKLDKIATAWSKKSAKKGSYAKPDWKKLPNAYEWAWYLPVKSWNPYDPTFADNIGSWFTDEDSPLLGCGPHEDGDDVVSDCSDSIEDLWSNLGFGFAWDKKGRLWVTLLLTTPKH